MLHSQRPSTVQTDGPKDGLDSRVSFTIVFSAIKALQTLERRKKLVFMKDNAPSHSARATKEFLASLGFKNQNLMVRPPNSPDLNPIENLWSIIKRIVYSDGKQFSSKVELWESIQVAGKAIDASTIANLTNSVNERIFEVIKRKGRFINI